MDVKYLKGTQEQYDAYLANNRIVDTNYYLISKVVEGVTKYNLYIGKVLLSENEAIEALTTRIGVVEEDVAWLKDNAGHKFYEVTALPTFAEGHAYKEGDVAVLTETKDGVEYKTAYHCIKDAEGNYSWAAMAGNYNASNVYYDKDIQVTKSVGNVTTSNNAPVDLKFKGKNMEQIWQYLYATEDLTLTINQPNASMTVSSSVSKEVGNTFSDPTITISFSAGDYEYGSKDANGNTYTKNQGTGVLWSNAEIKDGDGNSLATKTTSSNSSLTATYDIADNIVHEGTDTYSFSGTASCPASARKPVTNLGNFIDSNGAATTVYADGTKQTAAINAKPLSGSFSVTGWRGCFWGYKTSKAIVPAEITSDQIRALGNGPSNGLSSTITQSLNKMQQIFIAAPKGKYTTVTVTNTDLGAPQTVNKVTDIMVKGYNSYEAAAYDVFYVSNDNADSKAYNYKITIA